MYIFKTSWAVESPISLVFVPRELSSARARSQHRAWCCSEEPRTQSLVLSRCCCCGHSSAAASTRSKRCSSCSWCPGRTTTTPPSKRTRPGPYRPCRWRWSWSTIGRIFWRNTGSSTAKQAQSIPRWERPQQGHEFRRVYHMYMWLLRVYNNRRFRYMTPNACFPVVVHLWVRWHETKHKKRNWYRSDTHYPVKLCTCRVLCQTSKRWLDQLEPDPILFSISGALVCIWKHCSAARKLSLPVQALTC